MTSIVGEEPFNSVNFRSHWEETIMNAGKTLLFCDTVKKRMDWWSLSGFCCSMMLVDVIVLETVHVKLH